MPNLTVLFGPVPIEQFGCLSDHEIAGENTELCNVGIFRRDTKEFTEPLIGIMLTHIATLVQLVKLPVCFRYQLPKFSVCNCTKGNSSSSLYTDIGIAGWVVFTYIQHFVTSVFTLDSVGTSINGMTTAVGTTRCASIPSLSFFIMFHRNDPPKKKTPEGCVTVVFSSGAMSLRNL